MRTMAPALVAVLVLAMSHPAKSWGVRRAPGVARRGGVTMFMEKFWKRIADNTIARPSPFAVPNTAAQEAELLALAKTKAPAAELLPVFEALEEAAPAPEELLDENAELIDGPWSLLYTVSAVIGENITDRGVSGVVNASGITVDAAEDKVPIQAFDVANGRVSNTILTTLPLLGDVTVRVSGTFTRAEGEGKGRRAEVEFDLLEFMNGDASTTYFKAGWPFTLQRALKPELATGEEGTSWLDTTYISDKVRDGGFLGHCNPPI
mmetsp:Transcript_2113/g.6390  ORF Transcript_2113/g.6390 Transcript_2113/m.6390 type:complete len:264 (-) Transcript_2113:1410-2201(-)